MCCQSSAVMGLDIGAGEGVGVGVVVEVGVAVGVMVGVAVDVTVGVEVGVNVGDAVAVIVGVNVATFVIIGAFAIGVVGVGFSDVVEMAWWQPATLISNKNMGRITFIRSIERGIAENDKRRSRVSAPPFQPSS